jgi:membrane protease YdiL (CAAX protease family)
MSATILTGRAARLLFLVTTPFIYITSCLFVAASLAYPLQKLHLIPLDFHGLVGRGAYFLLIAGIYPIGRLLGVGRAELGLNLSIASALPRLGQGFALGILMLGAHTLLLVVLDVRHVDPERFGLKTILDAFWKAALVGLILGIAEELLFRGFLLGALRKKTGWLIAMLTSAFYFSALHFLSTDLRPGSEEAHWFTGYLLLGSAFEHLGSAQSDSFLALFTCGIFLAAVRITQPEKGLVYCIGVHAGWIFVMKVVKSFTSLTAPSPLSGLVSNFDGIIGLLSIAWLSLLIVFMLVRKS